jgi:hypothetical protein
MPLPRFQLGHVVDSRHRHRRHHRSHRGSGSPGSPGSPLLTCCVFTTVTDTSQLSFVGLRALHILSIASFPIILVLYAVLVGVMGDKLHLVYSDALATVVDVTPSGVLAFGATLIGFTVSYCSLASDFVSGYDRMSPRYPSSEDQGNSCRPADTIRSDNDPPVTYPARDPFPRHLDRSLHPHHAHPDPRCRRATRRVFLPRLGDCVIHRSAQPHLRNHGFRRRGAFRHGPLLLLGDCQHRPDDLQLRSQRAGGHPVACPR